MTMRVVVDNGPGKKRRSASGRSLKSTRQQIVLRAAVAADAPALHALIVAHLEEGRLLPRRLDELTVHASRFVVATAGDQIVGCAELAPLSKDVAEVRSLVVSVEARKLGAGARMVEELAYRARRDGYIKLSAFAHDPAFFVHRGFSIVPHTWVPEKIALDCTGCPLFRNCGQYAVVLDLDRAYAQTLINAAARERVRPTV